MNDIMNLVNNYVNEKRAHLFDRVKYDFDKKIEPSHSPAWFTTTNKETSNNINIHLHINL